MKALFTFIVFVAISLTEVANKKLQRDAASCNFKILFLKPTFQKLTAYEKSFNLGLLYSRNAQTVGLEVKQCSPLKNVTRCLLPRIDQLKKTEFLLKRPLI